MSGAVDWSLAEKVAVRVSGREPFADVGFDAGDTRVLMEDGRDDFLLDVEVLDFLQNLTHV